MSEKVFEVLMKFKDQLTPGVKNMAGKSTPSLGSMITKFKQLAVVIAGLVVIRQAVRWMAESVKMAMAAEVAHEKLRTTVKGNIDELVNLASALQQVTVYEDDTIKNAMSMMGTFGLNSEAVSVLTPRLLDMAASLQQAGDGAVNLQALAIALGKAVTTGAAALTRYGITLTDAQAAQLDTATGMDKINIIAEILDSNFKGLAEAVGNTFAGSVSKFTNVWGDMRESIGKWITESPGVVNVIKVLTGVVSDMTGAIDSTRDASIDLVGIGFAKLAQGAVWIMKILNGLKSTFYFLALAISEISLDIIDFGRIVGKVWNNVFSLIPGMKSLTIDLSSLDEAWVTMNLTAMELEQRLISSAAAQEGYNDIISKLGESVDTVSHVLQNGSGPLDNYAGALSGVAGAANAAADAVERVSRLGATSLLENFLSILTPTPRPVSDLAIPGFMEPKKISPQAPFELTSERAQKLGMTKPEYMAAIGYKVPSPKKGAPKYPGFGGMGSNDFLMQMAGMAVSNAMSGGGVGGFMAGALPAVGSLFGPAGSIVGGLLGGLFKKKTRGNTQNNPVFVHMTNARDLATEMLNISKVLWGGVGASGINSITSQLRLQVARVGGS